MEETISSLLVAEDVIEIRSGELVVVKSVELNTSLEILSVTEETVDDRPETVFSGKSVDRPGRDIPICSLTVVKKDWMVDGESVSSSKFSESVGIVVEDILCSTTVWEVKGSFVWLVTVEVSFTEDSPKLSVCSPVVSLLEKVVVPALSVDVVIFSV
jgi:hypothetical protein